MKLSSYGKIYNLGHKAIQHLFTGPVTVEEKVDGSQFSFGLVDGELCARSRNRMLDMHAADGMFEQALESVRERRSSLRPGYVYRGEYLQKPKHNTLAYERFPEGHIIIWDVDRGNQDYLPWEEKAELAKEIGLEVVPLMHVGMVESFDEMQDFMKRKSCLGGAMIEGLVFKNYALFDETTGKTLMGKHVAEQFREMNDADWKTRHPSQRDTWKDIGSKYSTVGRWHKCVQRLRDDGQLENTPRDIGPLLRELNRDIEEECIDDIKDRLWAAASKEIKRGACAGFPQWYKSELAKGQWGNE